MIQMDADEFAKTLLAWYDVHARVLPWRVGPGERTAPKGRRSRRRALPDPYRVWLSEIMLQQTTTVHAAPYYQNFTTRWPNVEALSQAAIEDLLAAWAGLGYYARARNLHKCAQMIVEQYGGEFPYTEKELLTLPGIGPYTAAAIAAIAFERPATVVDGNVERVIARLYRVETPLPDAKMELKARAAELTPELRSGDYAQAMMDLGATICAPRTPDCENCPVCAYCAVCGEENAAGYPRKKPKTKKPTRRGVAFVLQRADGSVLLRRRPEKGLLGGMLGVPTTPWEEALVEDPDAHAPLSADWRDAGQVEHVFTHFRLELSVWQAMAPMAAKGRKRAVDGEWVSDPLNAGLPTVMRKAVQRAQDAD